MAEGRERGVDLLEANLELVPVHLRHGLHLDRVDSGQPADREIEIDRLGVGGGLGEQRFDARFRV